MKLNKDQLKEMIEAWRDGCSTSYNDCPECIHYAYCNDYVQEIHRLIEKFSEWHERAGKCIDSDDNLKWVPIGFLKEIRDFGKEENNERT